MDQPENEAHNKRAPITDLQKLLLFGSGTLFVGTMIFMFTLQSVLQSLFNGRSGGSVMLIIGTAIAIGLLIAGGTIISKCVSRMIEPILKD